MFGPERGKGIANPASISGLVAFLIAMLVAWGVVWRQLGRGPQSSNRRRNRYQMMLLAMCAAGGTGFILDGQGGWACFMAIGLAFTLFIQSRVLVTCPARRALLSNVEWPASLPFCYQCGTRLEPPGEQTETEACPSRQERNESHSLIREANTLE